MFPLYAKHIRKIVQEIRAEFRLTDTVNVDALYMYHFFLRIHYFICKIMIYIHFDDLFEWDGFASKINSISFQAAFLAYNNSRATKNFATTIKHDEHRLYKILSKGVYETHMHLNGSGYSSEINLHNLICCEPYTSINSSLKNYPHLRDYWENNNARIYKLQSIRTYLLWVILGKEKENSFDILKILSSKRVFPSLSE